MGTPLVEFQQGNSVLIYVWIKISYVKFIFDPKEYTNPA
jgi:hypothetical protein